MDPAVDPDLRDTARNAWTFGVVAVVLATVAPCASYVTVAAALPLGLLAMSRARTVLASPNVDEATTIYARTGQILGLGAAAWSVLLLLFVSAIVLLYFGMFAVLITAGP